MPAGSAPSRTFSDPVGRLVDIWRKDTNPAVFVRVNACGVAIANAVFVVITAVVVPPQTPAFVHAIEQLLTTICNPFVPSVVNKVDPVPDNPSVGVIASSVPPFVRSTYGLIVSPGAIAVIAVTKPPVIPVPLTRTEFDFLKLLMTKPKHVYTREQVIKGVGGSAIFSSDHVLDTHASRLRMKIKSVGGP